MQTKKIYIKGMHCVSCEKLLDDEFRNIPGVKDVRVDRQTNTAELDYDGAALNFNEIRKVAKKYGYEAFENNLDSLGHLEPKGALSASSWSVWVKAILITAVLLFLFKIFQNTGVLNKIDLNGSGVSFGVALLVGLVASVSSCLAVVGAVIIAFGEKYQSGETSFYEGAVKPNLFFHVGRLVTFFVLGGLLGLIGGELNISGNAVSIFTIIVAIVMAWLGLNILGLLPSISNMGIRMPKGLTKNWDNLKKSEHQAAPFVLGGLSFFLPCGFTQSMQIFALTSGSFLTGGLTLFLFALGTVPVLLLVGVTASWTRNRKMFVFQKVAGFLIIFFAIYTLQSGLALSGVKTDVLSTGDQQTTTDNGNAPVVTGETQTVKMAITASGFSPSTLKIKKGVPVKWVINGDQVTGCTNKIIVPSLKISKSLSYGENVIEFTPTKAGEIPFSCWMGMVRGEFIVE
ncbi:MAG: sulfite exporter TauE/SafE family protein [Parcubacteria group bacterium]|jgi:sulfite exporter TauE/SafE/copper chaperone CopZ